jgi:tetratricopeptide (TPR) repeat protein
MTTFINLLRISFFVVFFGLHYIFNIDWLTAFLYSSILIVMNFYFTYKNPNLFTLDHFGWLRPSGSSTSNKSSELNEYNRAHNLYTNYLSRNPHGEIFTKLLPEEILVSRTDADLVEAESLLKSIKSPLISGSEMQAISNMLARIYRLQERFDEAIEELCIAINYIIGPFSSVDNRNLISSILNQFQGYVNGAYNRFSSSELELISAYLFILADISRLQEDYELTIVCIKLSYRIEKRLGRDSDMELCRELGKFIPVETEDYVRAYGL